MSHKKSSVLKNNYIIALITLLCSPFLLEATKPQLRKHVFVQNVTFSESVHNTIRRYARAIRTALQKKKTAQLRFLSQSQRAMSAGLTKLTDKTTQCITLLKKSSLFCKEIVLSHPKISVSCLCLLGTLIYGRKIIHTLAEMRERIANKIYATGIIRQHRSLTRLGTRLGANMRNPLIRRLLTQETIRQRGITECPICSCTPSEQEFYSLLCNHTYCKSCLNGMLTQALRNRSTAILLCPAPSCRRHLAEEEIRDISSREQLTAYYNITMTEYARGQHGFRQCPTPDCSYIFINDTNSQTTFQCPCCERYYCANCLLPHAQRTSCAQAQRDREVSISPDQAERATAEWKRAHTKQCPHCHRAIEKNEGCNHMTCQRAVGGCGHEFCWICLRPWSGRTCEYYQCSVR